MRNTAKSSIVFLAVLAMAVLGVMTPGTASADTWNPPRPAGIVPVDQPFLKLPFKRAFGQRLTVTQGWNEEATEETVIGPGVHAAIDFEGYPYGAPIVAAADGWAYYTYQRLIELVNYKDPITGRQINYIDEGAGLFVEVVHDKLATGVPGNPHWVTQYIHLDRVAAGIPYVTSTPSGTVTVGNQTITNYSPDGILRPQSELIRVGKRVRQGQVIGYMGDTGIGANWYDNWNPVLRTVLPRNRLVTPPWDPQGAYKVVSPTWATQLHFNLYAGRGADGKQGQQNRLDTFDLYAASDLGILPDHTYANPYTNNVKGGKPYAGPADSKTAFIRDSQGNLVFAG
ncbi:hypothetical protein GII36_02035 [Candidatus Mycosynbacter amalyticus]|uniref:M23 family metallopeptidase n=1 Tax=Candidatus Mycosynbacter amalyticus TaxID=2665156 RepID=A0A857MMX3_9BACT|nr:M23 family metallopeptidase [Candidatus Mycosynbacter amalyticus]QHN42629.1 hypothetical protein GII36_02035 [Candidatus Mycosynbacter amalyticus]